MTFLKRIIGFETFLVIFLFSYQIKHTAFFQQLPDLTITLSFLLLPWGLWIAKKEGSFKALYRDKITLLLLIFWAWLILSYFWSPQTFFSRSKIIVHSLFTMPLVLYASLFIAKSEQRLQRLFINLILFSLPVMAEIFYLYFTKDARYVDNVIFGTNYLVTGQTLGVSLLVLYGFSLKSLKEQSYKTVTIIILLMSFLAFSLLHTGGRGPLISTAVSFLLLTFLYKGQASFTRKFIPLGGLLSFTALQYFFFNFMGFTKESSTVERLLNTYDTTTHGIDESTALRLDYYVSSWQAFQENIFIGLGVAGWPTYVHDERVNAHPHNIFLEIGAELGLIGLFIFGSACLVLGLKIWQHFIKETPYTRDYILLGCLSFASFNALKSGDLNDNVLLFFTMALMGSCLFCTQKKTP